MIHKSKTPKVYKNKKLNNANFGTYNLNDYQVFLQLISKIGGVDGMGKHLQPEQLQRFHTLTAKEFSQQFGVELDGAYTTLKRVAKKLTETSITLEKPELFETWHIALCAEAKYNHKQGSLSIEFTPNIMPYLAQVKKKFVLYNLKEVANFGSLYSTRLYELIQEFKDTGYIIKSVAQLREVLAVGKKFKLYADFKRFTFAHAVNEINAQYELNLRFEEKKDNNNKKVMAIEFFFTPTIKHKGINPHTGQEVTTHIKPKPKKLPTKKYDDDTPQVHPDQQELPNIDSEKLKTKSQRFTKEHAEKNLAPSVKKIEDEVIENGTTKIIEALMKTKKLTKEEATLFAIKTELI